MKLTIPQIIMLNHAAWVNQQRSEERVKAKEHDEDPVVYKGKRVGELDTDELAAYWANTQG